MNRINFSFFFRKPVSLATCNAAAVYYRNHRYAPLFKKCLSVGTYWGKKSAVLAEGGNIHIPTILPKVNLCVSTLLCDTSLRTGGYQDGSLFLKPEDSGKFVSPPAPSRYVAANPNTTCAIQGRVGGN